MENYDSISYTIPKGTIGVAYYIENETFVKINTTKEQRLLYSEVNFKSLEALSILVPVCFKNY